MGAGRNKVSDDEIAIRAFVQNWFEASKSGDIDALLALMEEDAVFISPGAEPFGRDAFKAIAAQMKHMSLDMQSDILEVKILGDWAFFRSRLQVSVTPPGRAPMRRAGDTLTILHKSADGAWRLARDANMLV
jgi:uncharacterized protein (TIGR02246 family)